MQCNCCRCGKAFNYEKYYGICPQCAAYNRQPGTEQEDFDVEHDISARFDMGEYDSCAELHERYDSAPAHRPHEQHMAYHRTYDQGNVHSRNEQPYGTRSYRMQTDKKQNDGADSEKKKSKKWILVLVMIILISIFLIKSYSDFQKGNTVFWGNIASEVSVEAPQRTDVTEISKQGISIKADAVYDLGTSRELSFVPQFERLIAVHVTVVNEDSTMDGNFGAPLVECDGVYRGVLGRSRFREDMLAEIGNPEFTDRMLSEYSYTLDSDAGYFFYMIPEDAMDAGNGVRIVFEEYKSEDSNEVEKQYVFEFSAMETTGNGSAE